mmetsp:Transcript_19433/g.24754  ORF Transcript_19433/g.24754 Transcript_19433/m.24754 type:complete len:101 (+) Transcript_19433:1863-2165(+)
MADVMYRCALDCIQEIASQSTSKYVMISLLVNVIEGIFATECILVTEQIRKADASNSFLQANVLKEIVNVCTQGKRSHSYFVFIYYVIVALVSLRGSVLP